MTVQRLRYGGDYNPEHWPAASIDDDMRLMRIAGVNFVSLGIFGWGTVQPDPDTLDFSFYRTVLDRLHDNGIGVNLATMTASPPPWLTHRFPQILPTRADGTVLSAGSRQHYCPSSPEFRAAMSELVTAVATELGDHPAVQMWHLHNEYGCHTRACWCEVSAASFRSWLQQRYGSIDELNRAWTTTFWSQHYSDFAEVLPPRTAPTFPNNAQQLDFARFNSNELQSLMGLEIAILRRHTPDIPLTHNFAAVNPSLDLWSWARDLDVIAFDSYPDPSDPTAYLAAAFDYDVIRSLRGGAPWLLMEQAPSAVNWRVRNAPKPAGRMRVGSWQAVAHGADAVMFFQWRASPGGAEKFHSAMVGHTGEHSRVFDEVTALGAELAAHPELAGQHTRCQTGFLLDWDSWWAGELDSHPTADLTLRQQMMDWYAPANRRSIDVDAVHPTADLHGYRLLIAPSLYLLTDQGADNLTQWVQDGGVLVLTYFSAVADERDRIYPGGAPGPLRDLVGATVEEWWPLQPGDTVGVSLSDGGDGGALIRCTATIFTEFLVPHGAETLGSFIDGDLAGQPAVLRNQVGNGTVFYVGARLDADGAAAVLDQAVAAAGVRPVVVNAPDGVEVVARGTDADAVLFVLNHTNTPHSVSLQHPATDLLTGTGPSTTVHLDRYGVAILQSSKGMT